MKNDEMKRAASRGPFLLCSAIGPFNLYKLLLPPQQIDTWLREQHVTKGGFDPNTEVQKYSLEEIEAVMTE
ncbi:MAG: hypothetical protein EBY46_01290 [Rhodobacteraceae bacterium]|nr:hypothetical protein [Paracoccaceae bacterium]